MPKYIYWCHKCKTDFNINHSLQEVCETCENCGSENSVTRKPADIFVAKSQSNEQANVKAGDIVNKAIEDARIELSDDQRKLKKRRYKK